MSDSKFFTTTKKGELDAAETRKRGVALLPALSGSCHGHTLGLEPVQLYCC